MKSVYCLLWHQWLLFLTAIVDKFFREGKRKLQVSGRIPVHGEIMAGGARQYEPVPDEVTVAQARIEDKENGTRRVGQAARN